MVTNFDEWLVFLQRSHAAIGVPLIIAGLALMFVGWRVARFCVVAAFAAIGYFGVLLIPSLGKDPLIYSIGAAVALALLAYARPREAIPVLGGLTGTLIIMWSVTNMGLRGQLVWPVAGAAMLACTAWSAINQQFLSVVATSFQGAVLLLSGLAAVTMASPSLWGVVRGVAADYILAVPFLILVPTAVACFYQLADLKRVQAPT